MQLRKTERQFSERSPKQIVLYFLGIYMGDIGSQIPLNEPDSLVFLTLVLSESEQSFSCLHASGYTLLPPFVFSNVSMLSLLSASPLSSYMASIYNRKFQQDP